MAIARDGFVVTPGRMKRQPEIRQRIGGIGIDLERPRKEAERVDQAMALEVEHSEQMQRVKVIGPVRQDSGAQLFRPLKFALLKGMMSLPLQARQVRHPSRHLFPVRRQLWSLSGNRPSRKPSEVPTRAMSPRSQRIAFESANVRTLAFSAPCLNRNRPMSASAVTWTMLPIVPALAPVLDATILRADRCAADAGPGFLITGGKLRPMSPAPSAGRPDRRPPSTPTDKAA